MNFFESILEGSTSSTVENKVGKHSLDTKRLEIVYNWQWNVVLGSNFFAFADTVKEALKNSCLESTLPTFFEQLLRQYC